MQTAWSSYPGTSPGVQITQAWFCASQQGVSGKENQRKYVRRGEWHYCAPLVAESRILLTFGIWHSIKLAWAQGLAPACDKEERGQPRVWGAYLETHVCRWKKGKRFEWFIILQQCNIFSKVRFEISNNQWTFQLKKNHSINNFELSGQCWRQRADSACISTLF